MTPDDPKNPMSLTGALGSGSTSEPKPGTPAYNRMARRKAVRMGLSPTSGEEAVKMLKERGFDVTQDKVTMVAAAGATAAGENLPATIAAPRATSQTPAPQQQPGAISEEDRAAAIRKIQKDMAARRRNRFFLIFLRLAFFVLAPTALAGHYYYNIATPMYSVESQLVIQKSDGGGSGGLGGLLAGTGFGNSEDSIIVQGFLNSREAMLHLDEDLGFIAHFQQDFIDDIQRLPADASNEAAYKMYQKFISIGYDPSEGVIQMQVTAIDPETATAFSKALISYAEERVDQISAPVRADQMEGALRNYTSAEQAVKDAVQHVLNLQEARGVLSADAEISGQMSIINSLEIQVETKRLQMAQILANAQPNMARANVILAEINRLEQRVGELRGGLTTENASGASLARISGELRIADTNLTMRQLLLQTALTQMETARIAANQQVRYLSIGVAPVASDVPTHPKQMENTLLAFIIFLGLYIFISLTVSILREQIGS